MIWVGGHTAYRTVTLVEDGHVAVVYEFGEIVGLKGDGTQFIAPWQEVKTESTRVQRHTYNDVSGFSRETQDVTVSITVDYRVDGEAVAELYRQVGPNWFNTLVEPRVVQFFKAETVKYRADDLEANAGEIRRRVRDTLTVDLAPFGIAIEGLEMSDWNVTRR